MKKIKVAILLFMASCLCTICYGQDQKAQRIRSSYSIVTGRKPSAGELDYWMKQPDLTVQQLVAKHIEYSAKEPSFKRDLIIRSYTHALGRMPSEGEITYWMPGADTYNNLMRNHVSWLKVNPGEYEKVIKASYQKAMGRQPDAAELAWWKQQNVYSYAVLVHSHKDYMARNKTGMKNMFSNLVSNVMEAFPVNNAVAQEVMGLLGSSGATQVLAQGAAGIQSAMGSIVPVFENVL